MTSHEKRTLVAKFRIGGNLRFLSHLETMMLWSRALARSGVDVCFSSGFNPHPRLSLPLPRSVGVRSDDELLCAQVFADAGVRTDNLLEALRREVPEGCTVVSVELYEGKASFHAVGAIYEFALLAPASQELVGRVAALTAAAARGETITVQRQKEGGGAVSLDAGPYLVSADVADDRVTVNCRITPGGSLRVDEIMQLLGLEVEDLDGGVLRKSVQWQRN